MQRWQLSHCVADARRVALGRETMTGHLVRHRGHIAHARCVDPVVVELEQRANSDSIIERFIRPAGFANRISVGLADRRGILDHFLDERVERAILLRDRRRPDVVEYALNEVFIAQQLRRDRGV